MSAPAISASLVKELREQTAPGETTAAPVTTQEGETE